MSEKTEEPTPKRLRKAREDGDSGQSGFASQAVSFLVAAALVPAAAAALAEDVSGDLRSAIEAAAGGHGEVHFDAWFVLKRVFTLAAPVLAAAGVVGSVTTFIQTGGGFATGKLVPKLERLDIVSGFKNLVSMQKLFSVARALGLASLVAYVSYRTLRNHLPDFRNLAGSLGYSGTAASTMLGEIVRATAIGGLAVAALDVLVVRRGWKGRLRMSKDEVKREHKESDGDPQLKAARERAHHELLAQATVGNVKKASVVVVNPTHIACALQYDEGENDAPVVVATGEGELAAQIVRAARDYGIPVLRDIPLARALRELAVGEEIPEALYEAVAEILREAALERAKEQGEGP